LNILLSEDGQDVAEYVILAALILIVMMATIRLIGANASNIFSQVGSAIE
jgi:Flp pilus assembly pilin Flp